MQFESLSYQISIQNPNYDEQFFVSQFIKGLKSEIRGMVEAQVPETIERAILLALVQQEVLAYNKQHGQKQWPAARTEPAIPRQDSVKPALKLGQGDFWRDRQLRDYRRANGLCSKCGTKYDPTHQCAPKGKAELHLAQTEDTPELLSEEILNMMELHDLHQAEQLSLSIHDLAGTDGAETLRLRAMIGNQVLLILVDSGSSNSFINAAMLDHIQCSVEDTTSMPMKIANGEYMQCNKIVPALS